MNVVYKWGGQVYNLSSVQFSEDVVYQKLLKVVRFLTELLKVNADVFETQ